MPRSLDVELPRLRLVDRLAGRWERPVTVVVAGAGFGKTTVLAQAVRAHLLEPRGVDVWVDCAPVHESAEALAGALLDALPGPRGRGARAVIDALVRMAPLDVCLVLDDVHEIPSGSPGAALLAELVRGLPATAHLVLCGRELPDLPLARREAAGEVLRVGADELSFTETEVRALGRGLGRDPALAAAVRGWPALVRLAFEAGPSAPWRYAQEEILARLPDGQRDALAALAALHTATDDEVAAVTGEPVVLAELARRVPLVGVLEDGRYRAHELWAEALSVETRRLHRRAAEVLTARGDLARAGALARRGGDWGLLAELAVVLVNTTLSALPVVTARRWLERVPDIARDEPAFLLLHAAVLHASDFADPRIDPLLDRAWQGLKHTAVLGQAVITAHSRADLPRLAELARRAGELRGAPTAIALVLRHSVAATLAEVGGDPEAALAEIERAPVVDVPRPVALATVRFHYHCLNMCGRAGEAADLADEALADADEQHLRLNGPIARWFDGDPADLAVLRGAPLDGTARDSFVSAAFQAVIAACCGDSGDWCPLPCGDPAGHDNPRDAVLACAARAAVLVGGGQEALARRTFADHLARWPVTDRFHERHLRRFLALGYVLSDVLRAVWDRTDLGPSHAKARAAARALVLARAGDVGPAARLPFEHALCFLPLPWSVELAARLAEVGDLGLGGWLADVLGPVVHRSLRSAPPRGGAARLLAAVPPPPVTRTRVDVLGAMRVTRDGAPVDPPELRRVRVRQLLAALVVRPVLTREQACGLLWPDLDPADAARNLRVTLTHLRRLLDPDRARGDASFHLRTTGDAIRLVRSKWLEVDLWRLDALNAEVRAARAEGDLDRATELLAEAVELWRGDPLSDLLDLPAAEPGLEADRLRALHGRNLLDLGELCLVSGEPSRACYLAERVLAGDPFAPRAHRLLLAAALKSRDPARVTAARTTVVAALSQLGTPPDGATALLLRQALLPAAGREQRGAVVSSR
ncbi:BTAD domain-containing putative transcriptional regulator [Saccharothrix sp.]|uniref:BTAD domain-containing putative transcriptional regulator n=1 Tax=Saccharothrix sp. TaxID=1873460 RepID=UPI002811B6AF|nr:BTAD domain-containing putative transcriptional regulator [Saccharothrix sp.]